MDELEQRLDEVEAAQEEDRLSLLARLDALAVTADNAEEIGASPRQAEPDEYYAVRIYATSKPRDST